MLDLYYYCCHYFSFPIDKHSGNPLILRQHRNFLCHIRPQVYQLHTLEPSHKRKTGEKKDIFQINQKFKYADCNLLLLWRTQGFVSPICNSLYPPNRGTPHMCTKVKDNRATTLQISGKRS